MPSVRDRGHTTTSSETDTMAESASSRQTNRRKLKVGIAGVGVGAAEILPAMMAMPDIEIVAVADISQSVLDAFTHRQQARTYTSVEALCGDPDVDVVWVSTPNRLHAEHTVMAAERGKHVMVEKPMAVTLAEAGRMIEACDRNKVKLLCGHTQSLLPAMTTMRKLIVSGQYGEVRAMQVLAYTDWMLRPRTPDELDLRQGGGVPYRQGPHQVDTLRLLGGGMVRSVRGKTGQWFKGRPTIPGYYAAFMEFEDGTPANLVYNGYGYFVASELVPWGTQKNRYTAEERVVIRQELLTGKRNDMQAKNEMRIGGVSENAYTGDRSQPKPWAPNDLGLLIVSCERGDLRQSRFGILVHDDEGTKDIPIEGSMEDPLLARMVELQELYNCVVHDRPVRHGGAWGMATLEVCLAIMQSSNERREIMLRHQIPAPPLEPA